MSPRARDIHPTDEDLSEGTPDMGHPVGMQCPRVGGTWGTWLSWSPASEGREALSTAGQEAGATERSLRYGTIAALRNDRCATERSVRYGTIATCG